MNIIAVDDEPIALSGLQASISKVITGANVHGFGRAGDALAFHRETPCDVAFIDIRLGGMDGLELARRMLQVKKDTNIVFVTGYQSYMNDAFDLFASGYVMKPVSAADIRKQLDNLRYPVKEEERSCRVRMQCFGHFDVFVDGRPLTFERKKAKELLAYLVDRHGSSVTTEQMAAVLFEGENYDKRIKSRVTSASSSLQNTLKTAGIEDILVKSWGRLAIDPEKILCDAYEFEKGSGSAVRMFRGEYMAGYSWAEFTTGEYVSMEQERNV